MKTTYVFLAEGFEEIEALTVIDVLRRGGMNVKTVSITDALQIKGTHGVEVTADVLFAATDFSDAALLVLPGGLPGAENLYEFKPLCRLLEEHAAKGSDTRIASICASPALILGRLGLLRGERATSYPGTETFLEGADVTDDPVVVSGRYILGNGPANALIWSVEVLRCMAGESVAAEVATGMLLYQGNADCHRQCDFG